MIISLENVKSNFNSINFRWKGFLLLFRSAFVTPQDTMFTSVLLQISICSFHEHIRAESQRIISCSLVSASFCYGKNKKPTCFFCIFTGLFFLKGVLWNSKTSTDAVRITQSDKQSVFLLAVSRKNPSLNKTQVWRDKKQKIRPVYLVLLSSYFACLGFFLDNDLTESAK